MYRIKNKEEFEAEFGENWRGAFPGVGWPEMMDEMLGLILNEEFALKCMSMSDKILDDDRKEGFYYRSISYETFKNCWSICASMIIEDPEIEF